MKGPQASLVNRFIWNLRAKWYRASTAFLLTHRKTEIAKSARGPKIARAPCRERTGNQVLRAENFGDLMTTDHKVLSEDCESRNNHLYAIVVQDLATQWIQSNPCKTKKILVNGKEFTEVSRAVGQAESFFFLRAYKSSWSRRGHQKSLKLTIPSD